MRHFTGWQASPPTLSSSTQLIIEALEQLHHHGTTPATIDVVVQEACQITQPLAVEVFFTHSERSAVLTVNGDIDDSQLIDPTVYKSRTHFQLKYHLYCVGILTDGGTDTKSDVLDDSWELEELIE